MATEPIIVSAEDLARLRLIRLVTGETNGTTYVAVRCDQCKYWDSSDEKVGVCLRAREQDTKMYAEMYDAVLVSADFGCVQFKAKP